MYCAPALDLIIMSFSVLFWSVSVGLFIGFCMGVGCALAVMYSIYMYGYRAAIRDAHAAENKGHYQTELKKFLALNRNNSLPNTFRR
jgi:ABC-type nickel/cobalt efflux system permease component RcnA